MDTWNISQENKINELFIIIFIINIVIIVMLIMPDLIFSELVFYFLVKMVIKLIW